MEIEVNKEQEDQLTAQVPVGSFFEHYKGKKYKILGVGRHSETLEMCVVYEAQYDSPEFGRVWVRPLEMFLETIFINGKEVPRFKRIN